MFLANATADDEQIGPEKLFHHFQIFIQTFGKFLPREIVALTSGIRSARLGIFAFDLDVTELRVGKQLAAVKDC